MAHILLVEDDILLAEGVRDALQLDGHTVAIAHTAAGARESAQIFDLYLLDIRLPDGNGLPLCTALRRQQNAPVIFLTANDTEADVVRVGRASPYRPGCAAAGRTGDRSGKSHRAAKWQRHSAHCHRVEAAGAFGEAPGQGASS